AVAGIAEHAVHVPGTEPLHQVLANGLGHSDVSREPRYALQLRGAGHTGLRRLPRRLRAWMDPARPRARTAARLATLRRTSRRKLVCPGRDRVVDAALSEKQIVPSLSLYGRMSVLFKPWTNTAFRLALFGLALLFGGGLIAGPMIYVRSPLSTQQQDPMDQPVQFDHRQHVGDEGLACDTDPQRSVRPDEPVLSTAFTPGGEKEQLMLGERLKAEYHVATRTSCTTRHGWSCPASDPPEKVPPSRAPSGAAWTSASAALRLRASSRRAPRRSAAPRGASSSSCSARRWRSREQPGASSCRRSRSCRTRGSRRRSFPAARCTTQPRPRWEGGPRGSWRLPSRAGPPRSRAIRSIPPAWARPACSSR